MIFLFLRLQEMCIRDSSLGMEGESGCATYDYENGYLTDGVQYELLPSTKTAKYTFGVAWISPCTDKNEIQTWFGADPTL